jgi:hypothetical protein
VDGIGHLQLAGAASVGGNLLPGLLAFRCARYGRRSEASSAADNLVCWYGLPTNVRIRGTNKTITIRNCYPSRLGSNFLLAMYNAHHLYCTQLITWAVCISIGPERLLLRDPPTADLETCRPLSESHRRRESLTCGWQNASHQPSSFRDREDLIYGGTETSLTLSSAECGHLPSSRTLSDEALPLKPSALVALFGIFY